MENPANYSSLIQLAVTFNFVFVVFRHESEDKAKMLIDTFIEKWRKIFQEETNALFTAIQEMVYNKFSILKEKPVISKYHEELKKNYRSFQELISWYPKYLPRYCMMSGLYSLILLILLAELNFNNNLGVKTIELFLSFLVIYQLAYNGYYIIIEIIAFFQKKEQHEQKYMQQLIIFFVAIVIGTITSFCEIEIMDAKKLFYISIALAFSPFIVTFLYIIIFGTICICKLYIFISKIEAFRADFNKVVTGLTPKETFEYVSHRNVKSFEFYKFEGPKDSNN